MMLRPKFTPGPWTYTPNGLRGGRDITSDADNHRDAWIATAFSVEAENKFVTWLDEESPLYIPDAEAKANAELIHLAPRMASAIYELTQARKRSSQDFERRSYKKDIQSVMDAVEQLFEEV